MARKSPPNRWARALRRLLGGTIFVIALVAVVGGIILWDEITTDLPPVEDILNYRPPTSTRVLLEMAKTPVAFLPSGGIPIIDARVLALAHQRALESREAGRRFALVGPYLSYREQAQLVTELTGRPRWLVAIPDFWERPLTKLAGGFDRLTRGRGITLSAATVAGGFLQIHVKGDRADAAFNLCHPPPIQSIYEALADFQQSGRAPWLEFRKGAAPSLAPDFERPVAAKS